MAPENFFAKTSYSSDIFSMMVSIFLMVFGFPPFKMAKITDKLYKLIAQNKPLEYINAIKALSVSPIDKEFLDLFVKCIALQPERRLKLDAIKSHPWLSYGVATPEEVVELITQLKLSEKTE